MATPPSIYALGTVFGHYKLEKLLGIGGMGSVYAAKHQQLDKGVVVKILHPEFATNPTLRDRFMQEGRAASRVRHEHVVDVTDMGVAHGVPFLVMEHLEGETLLAMIKREGPLPIERAVDILLPVIAAVSSLHRRGVIHRDIKPDNIFLSRLPSGALHPKLLDFGIARILAGASARALTSMDDVLGTPAYMSPEQLKSTRRVDERTDQYALGLVLYECVTGQCPFKDAHVPTTAGRVLKGDFPAPRELRPDLPVELEEAILCAMSRDRERRFPAVESIGQELIPFASSAARRRWESTFPTQSGELPAAGSATDVDADATTRAFEALSAEESERLLQGVPAQPTAHIQQHTRSRSSTLVGASLFFFAVMLVVWQVAAPLATSAIATTTALYDLPRAPNTHAQPTVISAPVPRAFTLRADPTKAEVELDGIALGRTPVTFEIPRDRARHVLRVRADGYLPHEEVFESAPVSGQVSLRPMPVVLVGTAPLKTPPASTAAPAPRPTIRWRTVPHRARPIEVPY
jgi:serine/threonine-protein kinase